jgi:hypothetical protein
MTVAGDRGQGTGDREGRMALIWVDIRDINTPEVTEEGYLKQVM